MDVQISYQILEQVLGIPKEEQKKMSRFVIDRRYLDRMLEIAYDRGITDAQNSETWDDVSKSQYD
jgi:hypothetical protein